MIWLILAAVQVWSALVRGPRYLAANVLSTSALCAAAGRTPLVMQAVAVISAAQRPKKRAAAPA
eukprot:COSAG02_NODE_29654_length_565_cov_1.178112_1_plen_63_part_10